MWSLTIRGRHKLQFHKNEVLREVFRLKLDKKNKFTMLHNERLHDLYRSRSAVRRVKCRTL